MNKNLIIAGSVIAVGVIVYFVWKSKKATPATGQAAPATPTAGGIFAPKVLTDEDFSKLENVFKSGNPYNAEKAKAIEGQGIDENYPVRPDGNPKVLLTKQAFDNLVLAKIRRLIGERSPWIQEEENRRFQEWSGAARAGYNDSLARAFAYIMRVDTAITNYYTDTSTGATQTTNVDYNSQVEQSLRTLTWQPTNVSYILTAMQAGATGVRIYFDTNQYKLISTTEARTKGVNI